MERIRPIKYRPDWSQIDLRNLKKYFTQFKLTPEDVRKSNPWASQEEIDEWVTKSDRWSHYKQARFSPKSPLPRGLEEVNTLLGYGVANSINLMLLPAGQEIPDHADIIRKCGINFSKQMGAPIIVEDTEYNFDRFVFDSTVKHSVPVHTRDRITLQVAFYDNEYSDILNRLQKDGWV